MPRVKRTSAVSPGRAGVGHNIKKQRAVPVLRQSTRRSGRVKNLVAGLAAQARVETDLPLAVGQRVEVKWTDNTNYNAKVPSFDTTYMPVK